jgi:hypothetical protein
MAITAQDVAKGLSMFEIDESLEALVEAAEQEAEANNGEISEDIKTALATYAEAFGYKVDRIANSYGPKTQFLPFSAISGIEWRLYEPRMLQVGFGQTLSGVEAESVGVRNWAVHSEYSE